MEKLVLSIPEAVAASGFSRTSLYQEIGAGRLRAVKRGRRIAITSDDFKAWIKSLPEATITQAAA